MTKKLKFDNVELDISYLKRSEYVDKNDIITQCSNCRKTKRADDYDNWDWVQSFVANAPQNVSHSICPFCYDYFWKYRGANM